MNALENSHRRTAARWQRCGPRARVVSAAIGSLARRATVSNVEPRSLLRGGLIVLLTILTACGSSSHQVTSTVIVSTGSLVAGIHRAHQQLYVDATDRLRERVHGADYDREVAPIDDAFRRRSRAIQALSSVLYAAAYLNDAAGADASPDSRAAAARQVLETLRDATQVLADGSLLPAVAIPPEVLAVENALVALAGGH